jgi:hypothetical protein
MRKCLEGINYACIYMSISKCHPSQHTSNSNLMKIFFRFSLFVFASLSLSFSSNGKKERKKSDWTLFDSVPHERETRARDRCLFYTVRSLSYVCLCVCTYIYTHGGARVLPSKWSNNVTPSKKNSVESEKRTWVYKKYRCFVYNFDNCLWWYLLFLFFPIDSHWLIHASPRAHSVTTKLFRKLL